MSDLGLVGEQVEQATEAALDRVGARQRHGRADVRELCFDALDLGACLIAQLPHLCVRGVLDEQGGGVARRFTALASCFSRSAGLAAPTRAAARCANPRTNAAIAVGLPSSSRRRATSASLVR
ncbi:MAG TPA: hypothetical protein VH165_14335 [Kofleriaceae bacterium]|nr:hypothetical protein [Kofleriaceae bacterium]